MIEAFENRMRVRIDFRSLTFKPGTASRTGFALTLRKGCAFVFIQKILGYLSLLALVPHLEALMLARLSSSA
jgi:hypothetical protein